MKLHKLMIKTHSSTGLKYLCYTRRNDPDKYSGSGIYWKRHLRKYGFDFTTEIIFETDDYEEFKDYSYKKSVELDVVKSDDWANLVVESGDGWFGHHSDKSKAKMSESRKGKTRKPHSEETREKFKLAWTPERKKKVAEALSGRTVSLETRQKISKSKIGEKHPLFGKKHSEETRAKMKAAQAKRRLDKGGRVK